MRCPDCNKFVSNEQGEPELDLSVTQGDDGEAELSGSVRLTLNCADCGSELAEANPDIEETVQMEHNEGCEGGDLSVEDESAEAVDRYDAAKNPRYSRHYYGAEITCTIKCSCGAEVEHTFTVEEQASGFEQTY